MFWVYNRYQYFSFYSTGIVFIRQNLTSTDVRLWRINTVPALKRLSLATDSLQNTTIRPGECQIYEAYNSHEKPPSEGIRDVDASVDWKLGQSGRRWTNIKLPLFRYCVPAVILPFLAKKSLSMPASTFNRSKKFQTILQQ